MVALAAGALVTVGLIGLLAPSPGSGAPVPARCKTPQLSIKLVSFQRATGHRFWQLAFSNNGAKCSLHGGQLGICTDSERVSPVRPHPAG
jgi:hypothetical protein